MTKDEITAKMLAISESTDLFSDGSGERIVACVSACAGVPTHILEQQGVVVKPPYDPFYPDKSQEAADGQVKK